MLVSALKRSTVTVLSHPALARLMDPLRQNCIPIFMLHRPESKANGIYGHSLDVVRQALSFVKDERYNAIKLSDLIARLKNHEQLPPRTVCFTIDDGFLDQGTEIISIFKEFEIPITFFVATKMIDGSHWSWDYKLEYAIQQTTATDVTIIINGSPFKRNLTTEKERLSFIKDLHAHLKPVPIKVAELEVAHLAKSLDVSIPETPPSTYRNLTWEDLKAMESDLVEIGPHSCHHTIMTQLDGETAKQEIERSWDKLKEELKNPCPIFCYPTGRIGKDFTDRDKLLVQNSGLIAAVSADPGYVLPKHFAEEQYSLKRFSFPEQDITLFRQYCSWIERAKEIVRRRN